ncbi:MFS transporter [Aeromicrobium alkaliterrae]|uniref:MFS transporter n=2 Tax=Aeromicrobium alkaliterrae TaxID=302168 RepID=A0ABN2JYR2_9ACTN
MLVVSMVAQVAGTVANNAAPFLIPYLHLEQGLSLTHAGLIAAAPLAGTTVSLVAWGALVDRLGERLSLTVGLVGITAGAVAAGLVEGYGALAVCFFFLGLFAGSSNSASGRLVVGWFPAERRGTAMGIRQTGLPIGVGITALLVPTLATAQGIGTTMLVIAALCAATTVFTVVFVVDPPRPDRATARTTGQLASPYRGDRRLVRIHLASALLVVPQFTVWTFMLVWLIDTKDLGAAAAGGLVAASQLVGAAARIGVGWWSDRVGSRLRPLRQVAVVAALTMLLLGAVESTWVAIVVIVVATGVTVADNGLAFTAVAEIGGPYWAGKAMGWQNTGQYLIAMVVPPVVGAAVTQHGYAWTFAAVGVLPLLAIPLVPRERVGDPA